MKLDQYDIQLMLDTVGYIYIPDSNYETFLDISSSIGKLIKLTDVRIDNSKKWFLNKSDAFPMHTDHPDINFVAWFCIKQDNIYGATILIDVRPIIENMSEEMIYLLSSINIEIQQTSKYVPLLISTEPLKIHYAPWNIKYEQLSTKQIEAISDFNKKMSVLDKKLIRLNPNDILIINNNFILHGRDKIPQDSNRHLIRAYIG